MLCDGALLGKPRALLRAVATVHSIAFSAATRFSCDTRSRSDSSTCTATDLPPRSMTSCSRAEEVSVLSGPHSESTSAEGEALEGSSPTPVGCAVPVPTSCASDGRAAGEELARAGFGDGARRVP